MLHPKVHRKLQLMSQHRPTLQPKHQLQHHRNRSKSKKFNQNLPIKWYSLANQLHLFKKIMQLMFSRRVLLQRSASFKEVRTRCHLSNPRLLPLSILKHSSQPTCSQSHPAMRALQNRWASHSPRLIFLMQSFQLLQLPTHQPMLLLLLQFMLQQRHQFIHQRQLKLKLKQLLQLPPKCLLQHLLRLKNPVTWNLRSKVLLHLFNRPFKKLLAQRILLRSRSSLQIMKKPIKKSLRNH